MEASARREQTLRSGYDLVWGLKIPMRDAVELNGTVYRPWNQSAPVPVILTLTPYSGDKFHERAVYFAANGYVFVGVDSRGRGSSGGAFTPDLQEAKDGHDTVEFLARQPWCDGQVAMWGGSYRDRIDTIHAVESVTTPTFPHPVRLSQEQTTGLLLRPGRDSLKPVS